AIDSPACQRLLAAQENLQGDDQQAEINPGEQWPDFCNWVHEELRKDTGPLNRLCQHFELDLAEVYLLALLGEIEHNHLLSLAMAELQTPEAQERPSVNLSVAICDNLFAEHKLSTAQLSDNILFESGMIKLQGDGPLVIQQLSLDQNFWKALFSGKLSWPGISALPTQDFSLLPEPPDNGLTVSANDNLSHYLLKGDNDNNSIYAARLAAQWKKQGIQVSLSSWQQQPTLRLACQLTHCIPIIELPDSEQQALLPTSQYQGPVFLLGSSESHVVAKNLLEMQAPKLKKEQRESIWQQLLAPQKELADNFHHVRINGPQIQRIIKQARHLSGSQAGQGGLSVQHLRQAWGMISSESLITLAQSVEREIPKDALVLPGSIHSQLDDFMQRCKQREALWEGLGVTASGSTNYGVRGLFVGDSGTGKTLAASYLATRLGMPLYRVDISAIMNKYVGESEKNLNRLFNHASRYDVMLLLDEADALFGRRGDQDDPGARFGNMLTNFLLTRIESYSGIVVLTSNSRARIDPAFIRRLDTIIEFPRPEFGERLGIWQSHLGQRSPGEEICRRLASYCELPGGAIRNAVLFAAARHQNLDALDLLDGLAAEYRKLGKSLPAELQQWRQTEVESRDDKANGR
ncbi:MAG: ATP-binding protein, partial [Pseudomonadota bacterium]